MIIEFEINENHVEVSLGDHQNVVTGTRLHL